MFIIPETKNKIKWRRKKILNLYMSDKMQKVGYKRRAIRMRDCCNFIGIDRCKECNTVIFKRAYLCRDRFCPICSWRLSLKRFREMMGVFKYIFEEEKIDKKAMLLTLTIRNVPIKNLNEVCMNLSMAWKRMVELKIFKKSIEGYGRSLEITINKETGQAHPHLHVLVICDKEMKADELRVNMQKAWKKCNRVNYAPIVDAREAYSDDKSLSKTKIALEAFKYAMKPKDFDNLSTYSFKMLAMQIKNIRFISYGGIILKARQKLKMEARDEASGIVEEEIMKEEECEHKWIKAIAVWSFLEKDYIGSDGIEEIK